MKRANIYNKAWQKAKAIFRNPAKVRQVVNQAQQKRKNVADEKPFEQKVPQWKAKIALLGRMLKAYFSGNYVKIPKSVVIRSIATLLYFVWVVDAVPDFILVIGYVDDATVLAWLLSAVDQELETFREWEASTVQKEDH